MRLLPIIVLLLATASANAADTDWKVYTSVDLFAFSEPVSVERFAKNFDEPLGKGDTAFTHDQFEIGVRWQGFHFGYVHRFDYITRFTEDTALVHHSQKNGVALATNREYDLLLDVERISAKGFKGGYTWQALPNLSVDVSAAWYTDLSDLQSGQTTATGDLEPITDQLIADIEAVIDTISTSNRDLSPLIDLVADVNANILISYAYDQPKFDEPNYRKPIIVGDPNPVISGVDFSEPSGDGYSLDLAVAWQPLPQLGVRLKLMDIVNRFNWDRAPQTIATFDLHPALLDAIDVSQAFANGDVVKPNDIIDRHLVVNIFNADYEQSLHWRGVIDVDYSLDYEANLFGWTPNVSLLGGYYRTGTQNFPRVGIALDNALRIEYDIGGEALAVGYTGKYFFARVVTDSFSFEDAHTLGVAAGINYSF